MKHGRAKKAAPPKKMKHGRAKKAAPPPPTGPSPWLVYYDRKNHTKQIFCSNVSSPQLKTYHKKIPSLLGKKVLACSHGWLVLYDYSRKCLSLCDSTTFDTLPLPTLPHQLSHSRINSCILIPSESDTLKVLLFFDYIHTMLWCYIIGDDKWGEVSYWNHVQAYSEFSFLYQVVSCGRKLYARIFHKTDNSCRCEHGLFSIDIVEEPFGLGSFSRVHMRLFFPGTRDGYVSYGYLLGSFGELFWVEFKKGSMGSIESLVVKVQRYDETHSISDEGHWDSLKEVKDRAFFLGESYCLSCHESGGGRIYFTEDERLYCYNMEDDSVSVSLPCPDLPEWRLSSPIWIMPEPFASNNVEDDQQCIQENDGTLGVVETSCPEEDSGENGLLQEKLDTYVLENIVNQLTPLDYMNFRSVSRGCRAVAPLAEWRRGLSGSSLKNLNYTFPLLIFAVDQADESGLMYKLMDPRIKNNYYMMRVTESVFKTNRVPYFEDEKTLIHCSNHGCLLTSTGFDVYLHNPFTRSILSFPYPGRITENGNLFFKTMSSGLLILISVTFIHGGIVVHFTTISSVRGWRAVTLTSSRKFSATNINTMHFQDVVLFLDHNGNIGKLKLGEERDDISWHVLDQPKKPCEDFHPNFLVECGGQLLSVCVENGGRAGVLVYKLNQGEWAWERVMSLGDYSLYLSRSSSFSVLTTTPELRNRIYFPSLHGSSGIVFFSLETGKWHSSGSGESLNCFYGSRFQLNSCWIKPCWS